MKKLAFVAMGALVAGGALAAPDWSKVPQRKMTLFYAGQSSLEWLMNKADHSAVPDMVDKKRTCAKCHEGDANQIGDKIVAGMPVGISKTVLEPTPPVGKAGFIPVMFQAAHDGRKIYFRFEWVSPKGGANKPDPKNEVKLAMMFDGGGTVEGTELNGCWAACHTDLRTMKDAKNDKTTKHVKNADLASGKFMDLMQYRSGEKKPADGHVAEARYMEGGKALLKAEGKKDGNKWIVSFERTLAGGDKGDHAIVAGKVYNFGFSIHENHTDARFHHVSLGYQFGLDKPSPDVKSYINVQKQ